MILRIIFAVIVLAHGAVHAIMFALPFSAQALADLPFDPSRSWLLGRRRRVGLALAALVALGAAVAAGAIVADASWWPAATVTAAALSIVLLVLFLDRWWIVGILISVVIGAVALAAGSAD